MVKQWFAFLRPARVASAVDSRGLQAAAVALGLFSTTSWGAPSPIPLSPDEFLRLPSYELSQGGTSVKGASASYRVGDTLELHLDGLSFADDELAVSPLAEDGNPMDTGWSPAPQAKRLPDGTWSIFISLLQSGKITLSSLRLNAPNGAAIGRTVPFQVDVRSVLPSPQPSQEPEKEGPLGARGLGLPWSAIVAMILFAIVLLAGFVWLGLRWSRNRKGSLPEAPATPPRPEDVEALDALQAVEHKNWPSMGMPKPHYFAVSEVIKRYLGRRYEVDALESTSAELLRALEQPLAGFPEEARRRLASLFDQLDWVKFTDAKPTSAEAAQVLAEARALVEATRRSRTETPHAP